MTQLLSTVGAAEKGRERTTTRKDAPTWFDQSSVNLLHRALASAAKEENEIEMPQATHVTLKHFEAYVTDRGERDLVVQFIAPQCSKFEDVLPEIVESYFGTTDGFRLHIEPQIKSFGLLMEGIRGKPSFTYDHAVSGFLLLVDNTLSILREA